MKILLYLIFILLSTSGYSQKKDSVYILFNDCYRIMEKVDYTHLKQAGSPEEKLKKSIAYRIRQMEKDAYGDIKFKFFHSNQSRKTYEKFDGEPPLVLKKHKSFLESNKVLDIDFFRTTPYIEVCKTFEDENSWEQDVVIFMMDVDEMKNDSIILREVTFTRPVKE